MCYQPLLVYVLLFKLLKGRCDQREKLIFEKLSVCIINYSKMVITFLFNDKGMIQEWHKQYWYIYVNILQAAIKSLNTDKVNLLNESPVSMAQSLTWCTLVSRHSVSSTLTHNYNRTLSSHSVSSAFTHIEGFPPAILFVQHSILMVWFQRGY